MIEAQLAGLKAVFGVETDTDLANALGVDRSTIAQWRRRGQVSEHFQAVAAEGAGLVAEHLRLEAAGRRAVRSLVYRDPAYHLWTAAALSALKEEDLRGSEGETNQARGKRLERRLASLFSECLRYSRDELGKVRPEDEEDYSALVTALAKVPQPVPQSTSPAVPTPSTTTEEH